MVEIWIYEGRNSGPRAFWNYQDARDQQDEDNGCNLEDIQLYPELYGSPEWGGSEEEGWFYIDEGGAITKVEVEGKPKITMYMSAEDAIEKPVLPPVEFSVGDAVRTTQEWNDKYNDGLHFAGEVIDISDQGYGPDGKRRVQVKFPEPVFWNFDRLWFDPDELEMDFRS